jgi:hypothetical protein
MEKRIYLPVIASVLILAMVLASVMPVMAVTVLRARADPTLEVRTIAEDDEVRQTGVIVFGLYPGKGWPKPYENGTDKLAQYKILVTYNGVAVTFNVECQFIKKEKLHPLQKPQFVQENLRTVLTDESANFKCKLRSGKAGVGVLDVYYIGLQEKQFIADYIMKVHVWTTIGNFVIHGTEIQDVCVLGWAIDDNHLVFTKPDGTEHDSWPDALGPFVSCEEAAIWQRDFAFGGFPFSYD